MTLEYKGLQGITGSYKGLQGVTRGYNGLQGVTRGYRGLQWITGGYNGLLGVTRGYRGLQRNTGSYKGLWKLFLTRTFPDTFSWSVLHNKSKLKKSQIFDQNHGLIPFGSMPILVGV